MVMGCGREGSMRSAALRLQYAAASVAIEEAYGGGETILRQLP
jgi:hypothetical protein